MEDKLISSINNENLNNLLEIIPLNFDANRNFSVILNNNKFIKNKYYWIAYGIANNKLYYLKKYTNNDLSRYGLIRYYAFRLNNKYKYYLKKFDNLNLLIDFMFIFDINERITRKITNYGIVKETFAPNIRDIFFTVFNLMFFSY